MVETQAVETQPDEAIPNTVRDAARLRPIGLAMTRSL